MTAAAAANRRKGGRPRKVNDADGAKARQLREKGIAATDIAKMLGVSHATVYRYLSNGVPLFEFAQWKVTFEAPIDSFDLDDRWTTTP
jgi:transcriptional regulator with XRE-family HTH domain